MTELSRWPGGVIRGIVVGLAIVSGADQLTADEPVADQPPGANGADAEARLTDGSVLKLKLRTEIFVLATRYGELRIPVEDVVRVEFRTRSLEDEAVKIEKAIARLGHEDFTQRQAASRELFALGALAYPALTKATKHQDLEVASRAKMLARKMQEKFSEEQLAVREHDVVHTAKSRFAGRVEASMLEIDTRPFGRQTVDLAHLLSLRSLVREATGAVDPTKVLPDPGTLGQYHGQIGKTHFFKVTGAIRGTIWGTDVYTSDSTLATVAIHAGVLRPNETGVVRVTIVPPPEAYQGTVRNGVQSHPYGQYRGAYRVSR